MSRPLHRERAAAGVTQGVRVSVLDSGAVCNGSEELAEAIACERATLAHEHPLVACTIAVEGAQGPQIAAVERLPIALAAFESVHGDVAAPPVDRVPAHAD
jgi:hypothetical protein